MISFLRRVHGGYRRVCDRISWPVAGFPSWLPYVAGKYGLEIGGPSPVFGPGDAIPIYRAAGSVDNCDFSSRTLWVDHDYDFVYHPSDSSGKTFVCEGSQLTPIQSGSYDFVLSSHNLEHIANPLKALREWKRVLRPGGALILILPDYRNTFDHRRSPTPLAHMLDDFERDVGEDDLAHLPEILEKHDLGRDAPAGTFEEFRQRSLDNLGNRCLHHHVFDEINSQDLLRVAGFRVLNAEIARPNHICLLAQV